MQHMLVLLSVGVRSSCDPVCLLRSGLDANTVVDRMWVSGVMQRKMLFKSQNEWYIALGSNPCICYVPSFILD